MGASPDPWFRRRGNVEVVRSRTLQRGDSELVEWCWFWFGAPRFYLGTFWWATDAGHVAVKGRR